MITLNGIDLSEDLLWIDQYKWSSVEQNEQVMSDGSVVVQADAQQTGRKITLKGGDNFGLLKKSKLDAVAAFEAQAELQMTLTLNDGLPRNVVFTGDRLTAGPLIDYNTPDDDDDYTVTLYFMEL